MANIAPAQSRSWLWVVVMAMMILPGVASFLYLRSAPHKPIDTMAVLPFSYSKGDALSGQMSERITTDLYQQLSQLSDLKVASLESTSVYRDDSRSAQTIGHELRVRAIVRGAVEKREDGLRVTAELLDAGTNDLIWSGQYQLRTDDPGSVPVTIAKDITDHIRFH
jgi:TolB-like protein